VEEIKNFKAVLDWEKHLFSELSFYKVSPPACTTVQVAIEALVWHCQALYICTDDSWHVQPIPLPDDRLL
jgi:hypothetical protein